MVTMVGVILMVVVRQVRHGRAEKRGWGAGWLMYKMSSLFGDIFGCSANFLGTTQRKKNKSTVLMLYDKNIPIIVLAFLISPAK